MKIYLLDASKIRYEEMNSRLYNAWPEQYETLKAIEWAELLNKMIIPIRWNVPTRWGTSCVVKMAKTQNEYAKATEKLAEYIDDINDQYEALDIEINVKKIKR